MLLIYFRYSIKRGINEIKQSFEVDGIFLP